jgi:hypothetical protein
VQIIILVALLTACHRPAPVENIDTPVVDTNTNSEDTDVAPVTCDNVLIIDGGNNMPPDGDPENVLTRTYMDGLFIHGTQVQYDVGVTQVTEIVYDEDRRILSNVTTVYPCVDCDFTVEEGAISQSYTFEYLDAQNAITQTYYLPAYPGMDRAETYFYDTLGQEIRVETDWFTNGEGLDVIQEATYDERGNVTSRIVVDPVTLERTVAETLEYDEFNHMTLVDDSLQQTRWDYAADNLSYVLEYERKPLDGVPEYTNRAVLNSFGGVVTMEYDMDGNGVTDFSDYHEYDSGNRETLYESSDAAGVLQTHNTSEYDNRGLLIRYTEDFPEADGEPNAVYTATYDSAGRQLTWDTDGGVTPADGALDQHQAWTYGCPP